MSLVSMKNKKKSKVELKKLMEGSSPEEQEEWPWGLRLRFEKEQIEKLPLLDKLEVGDSVKISAEGMVSTVSNFERQDGEDDHTVEIQLKKVGVEKGK